MGRNHSKTSNKEEKVEYDYTMIDDLFAILDQDHEIQPILCGYFNKIVQALLGKIKQKMLHYILIHRQGDIFNKLLKNLQYHSLS
jgi:hypothetical protein